MCSSDLIAGDAVLMAFETQKVLERYRNRLIVVDDKNVSHG